MIFADYAELERAKSQLKDELKSEVTNVFDDLFERCYFKAYDTLVLGLDSIEHAFLKFTKGHKKEWCDKTSLLFKTAFDSIVEVLYKDELFDEEWFMCSKCLKSTDYYDEERSFCLCKSCEESTTQK